MKPPFEITPDIISRISSISQKIGEAHGFYLNRPSPQLRKENRIKTIHSSLHIEGNTLSQEHITAILENQRVIGPAKDIREVVNALRVYDQLDALVPTSERSFLHAHKMLMEGLVLDAGAYRKGGVGIMKGSSVAHVAPPAERVGELMRELFAYVRTGRDHVLIKSCVFHYELVFIHPFSDGNGRMGRLWQTALLMNSFPVFEFLPFETLIAQRQEGYYRALAASDKAGASTRFIEFMLHILDDALADAVRASRPQMKEVDRLDYYTSLGIRAFSRHDYMQVFKHISSATASRDLAKGVELGHFEKHGRGNQTTYTVRARPL